MGISWRATRRGQADMRWTDYVKILSAVIYFFGANIVLALSAIWLFGPDRVLNPDAMLPMTWRESAFMGLAFGCIPMLFITFAVYIFYRNFLQSGKHPKRNTIFLFLPGFVCLVCAMVVIGALAIGYIQNLF